MSDTYRHNENDKYPCVTVDTDGGLYLERSDDSWEDVTLRLSPADKLGLAADLIQAARKELCDEALAAANAEREDKP